MKKEYQARFGDAPWFGNTKKIVLGGAGGIGSWVALALARCGHELYVYDMDSFDINNMGGQFCTEEGIGKLKTTELQKNIKAFTGGNINTFSKFDEGSFVTPITIAAFDNMEARRIMFDKWKEQENRELFIDARMTAEYFEVYAIQKGMEDKYEEVWFPSSEANVLPCSFKSTTHNAMGIAWILTGTLNNFLSNDPSGMRLVPFSQKMNIALMMFETEE